MNRIAIFPGTFDPITKGHEDIALRALDLFDEVIIAIGENSTKSYLFPLEQRKSFIEKTFSGVTKISVASYSGLTVDFCHKINARHIIRGLRSSTDFEFEKAIAQMNKSLAPEIETLFMMSRPEYSHMASSIVRDILRHKGDVSFFIPTSIQL